MSKPHRPHLTWPQLEEIKARLAAGESIASIARALGVGRGSISAIKRGLTWQDSPPPGELVPDEDHSVSFPTLSGYLTAWQAAALLSVSKQRIQQLEKTGQLSSRHIGRHVLYREADVLARLAERQQRADQWMKDHQHLPALKHRKPPPPVKTRICIYCGQPFEVFREKDKQQFCSRSHATHYAQEHRKTGAPPPRQEETSKRVFRIALTFANGHHQRTHWTVSQLATALRQWNDPEHPTFKGLVKLEFQPAEEREPQA